MKCSFDYVIACAVLVAGGLVPQLWGEGFALSGTGTWRRDDRVSMATAQPFGTGFSRDGETAVCTNADAKGASGLGWSLALNQAVAAPVRLSAEGWAEKPPRGGHFELFVDVDYMDGTTEWALRAPFCADAAAGWTRQTLTLDGKAIRRLSAYALFRGAAGVVRFRRPAFEEIHPEGGARLDGVFVQPDARLSQECLLLRDVGRNTGFAPFRAGVCNGVKAVQTQTRDGAGAVRHRVRLEGAPASEDRALTLVYALPLEPGELTWFADPRHSRVVTARDGEQRVTSPVPYGQQALSLWPFAACAVADRGQALAVDLAAPAVYRVTLNPELRLLYISFDVALAPEKNTAEVGFVTFPFAARDGFRGALEAWGRLEPSAVENRMEKIGLWDAFTPIKNIPRYEDFHFAYVEGDTANAAWYDERGISCFTYTEPSSWWMHLKGKDGNLPTYAECVAEVARLAAEAPSMDAAAWSKHAAALAWQTSAAMDAFGRRVGHIQSTAWTPSGIMWSFNSAPGIKGEVTDYKIKVSEARFKKMYGGAPYPKGVDGEYIDSSEMGFSIGADYDRAHFAAMETPLCWSGPSNRVCISGGLVSYEYVRSIRRRLDAYGRRMMANSTPKKTSLIVPWADVPGTEVDWNRGGKWNPSPHDEMIYWRAIAGRKPYCLLQNTNYKIFTRELVVRYMERALAYGMLPSYFSNDGYTDRYFENPAYYERDRDLFRTYVPLAIELATAGWQPVRTLVSCADESVFVEQFGDRYATVFNSSVGQAKRVTLRSGRASAAERVTGATCAFADGVAVLEIPPESVRLLDFGAVSPKVPSGGTQGPSTCPVRRRP